MLGWCLLHPIGHVNVGDHGEGAATAVPGVKLELHGRCHGPVARSRYVRGLPLPRALGEQPVWHLPLSRTVSKFCDGPTKLLHMTIPSSTGRDAAKPVKSLREA